MCHRHKALLTFILKQIMRGRPGRDHMVVGFTTTCVVSVYRH
jgi:hypothetical protein